MADAGFDSDPHRLDARSMAGASRETASLRPSAVTIHDDGDMAGKSHMRRLVGKRRFVEALLQSVAYGP